jgi:3-isopropylmalate/(R)-2-methylmalate dehydratase small subunit
MTAKCRVWKFGDDVSTDLIIPGRYLDDYDPEHLASHVMEGASKEFSKKVSKGDIVVAGKNFGCGSSREQAVTALKHAGVSAVIAESFARIFYRNAINLGMPVLLSRDASGKLADGDLVELDLLNLRILGSSGGTISLEPLPAHLQEILNQGGLLPYIKARL